MRDEEPRRHAFLVELGEIGLHHRAALAFLDENGELLVRPGRVLGKRMLRGHGAEGGPHQRVGARGEHAQDLLLRSEEHTSELQSPDHLVSRLLLEKKNTTSY